MKELEKNGLEEQEMKMRKALDDVKSILDRHCEQGELEQETHDRILEEMNRIFHDRMEAETKDWNTKDSKGGNRGKEGKK